jgi:hypothetical protein
VSARRCVTFEVRKYAEGRWLIDSIFDDQALAVQEAEFLVNSFKTLMAVRVIAVSEGEGEYREWPIFKYENGKATRSAPRPEDRPHQSAGGGARQPVARFREARRSRACRAAPPFLRLGLLCAIDLRHDRGHRRGHSRRRSPEKHLVGPNERTA